ncbi:hypothetical protein [Microbulbifer epialgicus]|uniref:Uncharacterized protein n=1 Tax=Microbulbifer epialgicus TaxID=393907 RepID=A0ABV4NYP3_9GAMM
MTRKKVATSPAVNTERPSTQVESQEVERHIAENTVKVKTEQSPVLSHPDNEEQGKSMSNSELPLSAGEPNTQVKPQQPERLSVENPDKVNGTISRPKPETPSTISTRFMDMPVNFGTESQSTVFDPVMERKLARERSKVPRFEHTEVNYTTATGTFVQVGDRCFDVKDMPPGNRNSDLNPWFGAKCPNNSRSKEDIDRLAEKYGIP